MDEHSAHAPTLWEEIRSLERRTRDLEIGHARIDTRLSEIEDKLDTLIKIAIAILGGLLGVAVAIALAVH